MAAPFLISVAWHPHQARALPRRETHVDDDALLCPHCGAPLRIASEWNFAHPASSDCSSAKAMIEGTRLLLLQRLEGGAMTRPRLLRKCTACHLETSEPLPADIVGAVPVSDSALALVDASGRTRVMATIDCDIYWGAPAEEADVPAMVLDALDLALDTATWPVRGDGLHPHGRPRCETRGAAAGMGARRRAERHAERERNQVEQRSQLEPLCAQHGLPVGGNGYDAVPYRCFRCDAPTVVYRWTGHRPQEPDAPPEPRPWTVQWRYTQELGDRYWANTCVKCKTVQGDHYLYRHPSGPFFRGFAGP